MALSGRFLLVVALVLALFFTLVGGVILYHKAFAAILEKL